ncbi:hypothetical protein R3P38DRAFT_123693 [Favolaschia claudopus]|uniref:Secreted protein n=1 Tax=Favolaschia claudopus TaxID=2862362 RepID=A0AAV9ZWM9_9AGAR
MLLLTAAALLTLGLRRRHVGWAAAYVVRSLLSFVSSISLTPFRTQNRRPTTTGSEHTTGTTTFPDICLTAKVDR